VALVGLVAGVIPALQASKTNVNETLKAQFTARAPRLGRRRSLQALMIGEVALTLVLLVGAGLMIKSFLQLLVVPKGFNPDNVLTLLLSPSLAKYPPGSPQLRAYYQESLTRVQTLPGIHSAGLTSFLPLAGPGGSGSFKIEGRPPFEPGKEPSAQNNLISHDYFRTMGIEMRAGRAFTSQDGADAPSVAIINETMARRFFPNENPIGHRFVGSPTPWTIVGVVGDTRHFGLDQAVSQRTHEIGIRMALGAQGGDVLRLVVGQGMRVTLIGVTLGLAAALALTRVMQDLLFNVSPTDSATFASITLLLVIIALLASYIPARRATTVDPLTALRRE
jgi:FtsX-like permease family/MacB-like periplasmic core domain